MAPSQAWTKRDVPKVRRESQSFPLVPQNLALIAELTGRRFAVDPQARLEVVRRVSPAGLETMTWNVVVKDPWNTHSWFIVGTLGFQAALAETQRRAAAGDVYAQQQIARLLAQARAYGAPAI